MSGLNIHTIKRAARKEAWYSDSQNPFRRFGSPSNLEENRLERHEDGIREEEPTSPLAASSTEPMWISRSILAHSPEYKSREAELEAGYQIDGMLAAEKIETRSSGTSALYHAMSSESGRGNIDTVSGDQGQTSSSIIDFAPINRAPTRRTDSLSTNKQLGLTAQMSSTLGPRQQAVRVAFISHPMTTKDSNQQLKLVEAEFQESTCVQFPFILRDQMQNSTDLIFMIVDGWGKGMAREFQRCMPAFPTYLPGIVNEDRGDTITLPSFPRPNEFFFRMNHIDVFQAPQDGIHTPASLKLGFVEARHLPLATWVCLNGGVKSFAARGIIVICGSFAHFEPRKILDHYSADDLRRWKRLNSCPYWVSLDMFYLSSNWDRTLEAVRQDLAPKARQLYGLEAAPSILRQTRTLHQDTATTLAFSEAIRLHVACFKRFQRHLNKMTVTETTGPIVGLKERFEDVIELLQYYEVTTQTIFDQQQNLLSLTFNTETVLQGNAVARINALAFIFLPLSFVASIFGMTTFTTAVYWYPVVAVPVLLFTITIAFLVNKIVHYNETQEIPWIKSTFTSLRKVPLIRTLRGPERRWNQRHRSANLRMPMSHLDDPTGANIPSFLGPIPEIVTTAAAMESDAQPNSSEKNYNTKSENLTPVPPKSALIATVRAPTTEDTIGEVSLMTPTKDPSKSRLSSEINPDEGSHSPDSLSKMKGKETVICTEIAGI